MPLHGKLVMTFQSKMIRNTDRVSTILSYIYKGGTNPGEEILNPLKQP